jgi:hypothetical protein
MPTMPLRLPLRRILPFAAVLVSACAASAQTPDAATRLKAGLGGDAVDNVQRFDYRLTVRDAGDAVLRDGEYALLPQTRQVHVRDLSSASRAQVWSGDGNDTWRLDGGQWEFLGPQAAAPYRRHVDYHFVPLLRDARTKYQFAATDRIRISPADAPAFEVRIDLRNGRILENHFDGGTFARELDYRDIAGLQWPMGFEVVENGRTSRRGRFSETAVVAEAALPPMPPAASTRQLADAAEGVARLVGAGWMSADGNEYNISLDAGERTMVFARSQAEFEHARILFSRRNTDAWSEPQPVPFADARYSDSDPWLTPDGHTLYFVSNRPFDGEAAPRKDLDLWRVEVRDDGFGTPEHLAALSSDGQELGPELHDGWLYFNSTRKGGPARMSIYRARLGAGGFESPQPLGAPFNDGAVQGDFTLSPDGRMAVFWSVREGDEADLFAVRREDQGWSKAQRLPSPINAAGLDFTPSFSTDGRTLRFASMRRPAWLDAAHPLFNGQSNLYVVLATTVERAFTPSR